MTSIASMTAALIPAMLRMRHPAIRSFSHGFGGEWYAKHTDGLRRQTGAITVADPSVLDFETTPSFVLTVQVVDNHGAIDSATVTVDLSDVDESVRMNLGGSAVTWLSAQPPVVVLPQLTVNEAANLTGRHRGGDPDDSREPSPASGMALLDVSAAVAGIEPPGHALAAN